MIRTSRICGPRATCRTKLAVRTRRIALARSLLYPHVTMNKINKTPKLKLNQETVRTLEGERLKLVAGGYFSQISVCIFNKCGQQ
jgi:hypothetical protein